MNVKYARIAALLAVSFASFCEAAEIKFTGPDGGTYDLASPSTWSDVGLPQPTSSDKVVFQQTRSLFTASSDVTFSGIQIQRSSSGATNVFKLAEGRKITLANGGFDSYYAKAHTTLDGGEWSMSGQLKVSAGTQGRNGTLILTNGVKVTASSVGAGLGASGGYAHVTDGSSITATSPNIFGTGTSDAVFRIDDGSSMAVKGDFWITASDSRNCRMYVSGEDTCITSTAAFRSMSSNAISNQLVVSDGALFDFAGRASRFGEGSATSNKFVFTSGARARFSDINLNFDNAGCGNSIEVSDGATLDCCSGAAASGDRKLSVGGLGGSEILVSNATVRCTSITLGTTATSSRNCLRVMGPQSSIISSLASDKNFDIFGIGGNNEVVVDDRALVAITNLFLYSSYASGAGSGSNIVRVVNGAELRVRNTWIGTTVGGNRLEVSSGGEFSLVQGNAPVLYTYAPDAAVVLSNGTVRTLGTNAAIHFGDNFTYNQAVPVASPNNSLSVQGTNSLLLATGALSFNNTAKLRFDLPAEGFCRTPIQVNSMTLSDDCEIAVSCAAFQGRLARRARLALVETESGVTVPEAVLARANAALGSSKARIYVSDDGMSLMMDVGADTGMFLILK